MARRDEDGYYYLVDRKSNMIISGGENVYPSEVESVLGSHPKVKDVAVIGVPDDTWGEAVHAPSWCCTTASARLRTRCSMVPGPGSPATSAPKSIAFIREEADAPDRHRQDLHRVLRERHPIPSS